MTERWREAARCRDEGLVLFFPREQHEDEADDDYRKVVHRHTEFPASFCRRCPVREECFALSMKKRATEGVFGGVNQVIRQRWLKAGRKWRCQADGCGKTIDPFTLLSDPDIDRCEEHR